MSGEGVSHGLRMLDGLVWVLDPIFVLGQFRYVRGHVAIYFTRFLVWGVLMFFGDD